MAFTIQCKFLAILAVAIVLPLQVNAEESLECEKAYEGIGHAIANSEDNGVFRYTEPQGFAEVIPSLNRWQGQVKLHPESEVVELTGVLNGTDSNQFLMTFDKAFRSNEFRPRQDSGKGLRFDMHSDRPGLEIEVELRGTVPVTGDSYVFSAKILSNGKDQSVVIPWEKFHLKDQIKVVLIDSDRIGREELKHSVIKVPNRYSGVPEDLSVTIYPKGTGFSASELPIEATAFNIRNPKAPVGTARSFNVQLKHSIYRDFDLNWPGLTSPQFLNANKMMPGALVPPITGTGKRLVEFMVSKLQDVKAQNYALDIISHGDAAIEAELNKYSFSMKEMPEKLTAEQFFGYFSEDPRFTQMVPIEKGAFALHHGRYTHAAQILTLLHEISPTDLANLRTLHTLFASQGPLKLWENMWNIFFDAPGDYGPNCPLWWVKQFQLRHIKAEPASRAPAH